MPKTTVVFTFVLLAALTFAKAAGARAEEKGQPVPSIRGLWYTQDRDGGIELYPCDGKICGRFYWLKDDDDEGGVDISRDDHNPDPAKRARSLCRMQFMGGFTEDHDKAGHYVDGWIYSPRHGKVFNADMTLVDPNTLKLHGYVIVPLFGESQLWTRAAILPKCRQK